MTLHELIVRVAWSAFMTGSIEGRLISKIYDVAVDETCLDEALVELANATGCLTASLEIYSNGTSQFMEGRNPLISPEDAQSYLEYWRHHLPSRRSSAPFPVSKVLCSVDLWDRDKVVRSGFFNDWLRPQGMGGDGRYANVSRTDGTVAVLGAFKPYKSPTFDAAQRHLFQVAAHHFSRAVDVNLRLRRAELLQDAAATFEPAVEYLVLDEGGSIVECHEQTRRKLALWGLLKSDGSNDRLNCADQGLSWVVHKATNRRTMASSGEIEMISPTGTRLVVSVTPLRPECATRSPWLAVQRPAALVRIVARDEALAARVRQVADHYGLTHAERQVAAETVKGHGRKAIAAGLGLKETTVRTHLSAIFAKMGIQRQAELCRAILDDRRTKPGPGQDGS